MSFLIISDSIAEESKKIKTPKNLHPGEYALASFSIKAGSTVYLCLVIKLLLFLSNVARQTLYLIMKNQVIKQVYEEGFNHNILRKAKSNI